MPHGSLLAVGTGALSAMAPTAMLKLIVFEPGVLLASRIACRNEPGPLSLVFVTT